MNLALRKRHLYTWIVIAILLPVGMFVAFQAIPTTTISNQQLVFSQSAIEKVAPIQSSDCCDFALINGGLGQKKLQIEVKKAIEYPSVLVYQTAKLDDPIEQGTLLGQLTTQNLYQFDLAPNTSGQYNFAIQLYDGIKKSIIQKVELKTAKR